MTKFTTTSSTMGTVFSLTTTTTNDLGDFVTVHNAVLGAGFVCNTSGMVLVGCDTGVVLAALEYVGFQPAGATIKRIDVRLGAAIEIGMGSVLVATLEALRDDLNGSVICDVHGIQMALPALQAVADALDAEAVQRIEARRPATASS